tara:strand:+ start:258 stop:1061 length:804 start_codon:yes stop_codon:yes gene_type:complete
MKKVVILGSTGMLGNSVASVFDAINDLEILYSHRTEVVAREQNSFYFDATLSDLSIIPDCDYIINCIGVIKPFMKLNIENSIYINSIFPHKLSKYCKVKEIKLIHITTDCVFSGLVGKYHESSVHDCEDEYGKSKSLGEPSNCMVLRTSIIGEEIHKNASLIEWVKSNEGGEINGFTNHMWNGVTTKHYGELCAQIIRKDMYEDGLFHVHSNEVSKYELLNMINRRFSLNITITPIKAKKIDRTLTSNLDLVKNLKIKSIQQQIGEL